mmetsp:Transcript_22808/g.67155  ORF Transcript_22808/g.67155 Transcript_22808/m.67155 type:complete len:221 (-) Transcript_22808:28-690(-)
MCSCESMWRRSSLTACSGKPPASAAVAGSKNGGRSGAFEWLYCTPASNASGSSMWAALTTTAAMCNIPAPPSEAASPERGIPPPSADRSMRKTVPVSSQNPPLSTSRSATPRALSPCFAARSASRARSSQKRSRTMCSGQTTSTSDSELAMKEGSSIRARIACKKVPEAAACLCCSSAYAAPSAHSDMGELQVQPSLQHLSITGGWPAAPQSLVLSCWER